jgi:multicomponent Na+:H+ antiporter subunit F
MVEIAINIAICILLAAVPIIMVRLIKGPSTLDRVLCLDGIAVTFVAIMAILSMKWRTAFYLDLILIFSTFGFLSTVAFAYYLRKTYEPKKEKEDIK